MILGQEQEERREVVVQHHQQQLLNEELRKRSAVDRIRFIVQYARRHKLQIVQTTSFGIESALMLQLLALATVGTEPDDDDDRSVSAVTTTNKKIPIIFIDTGYLPNETYQFADDMTKRFGLDDQLHIYQSVLSPARMEATYGRLWENESDEAHQLYNTLRKVIPMETALNDLGAHIVLTGVRASQTKHRENLSFVNIEHQHADPDPSSSASPLPPPTRWKVCPLLDWDDDHVRDFFRQYRLPYHPLFEKGYRTVGDWHSSQPYDPVKHPNIRASRFHGRTQECGLHISISSNLSLATGTQPPVPDRSTSSPASLPPSLVSTTTLNESDTSNSGTSEDGLSTLSLQSSSSQYHPHDDDVAIVPVKNHGLPYEDNDDDGFVIYGRPNCQYCIAAKTLLRQVIDRFDPDLSLVEIHVGHDITTEELWSRLADHTIQTVPQIVYRGYHIGGYTDLCQWGLQQYHPHTFRELCHGVVCNGGVVAAAVTAADQC
jgi:phosphoadenosine phosphosulfate reductase